MRLKDIVNIYCDPINELLKLSTGTEYMAMSVELNPDRMAQGAEAQVQFHAMQKIYILSLIERAHFCSVTSLARASRWLTASLQMEFSNNLLGYSAAIRGFLEGAADAFDVMSVLPKGISEAAPYWFTALHDPDTLSPYAATFKVLEDKLIHYAYAGHVPRNVTPLPQHRNKSNAEYIRVIEDFGVPGAGELYAECCELTHPASPSVMCFAIQTPPIITFNPNRDAELIEQFYKRHEQAMLMLAQNSINPAYVSLALLNRLDPSYPAPSDHMISQIGQGSATAAVKRLENFITHYQSDKIDPVQIVRWLNP